MQQASASHGLVCGDVAGAWVLLLPTIHHAAFADGGLTGILVDRLQGSKAGPALLECGPVVDEGGINGYNLVLGLLGPFIKYRSKQGARLR
jgi:hypothetical protein